MGGFGDETRNIPLLGSGRGYAFFLRPGKYGTVPHLHVNDGELVIRNAGYCIPYPLGYGFASVQNASFSLALLGLPGIGLLIRYRLTAAHPDGHTRQVNISRLKLRQAGGTAKPDSA